MSESEVMTLDVLWNNCIADRSVCPAGFSDLTDGQKELLKSILKDRKRYKDHHVKLGISGENVCVRVCVGASTLPQLLVISALARMATCSE